MVKDPYQEWDRVYTFCTLLANLGGCVRFWMKKIQQYYDDKKVLSFFSRKMV